MTVCIPEAARAWGAFEAIAVALLGGSRGKMLSAGNIFGSCGREKLDISDIPALPMTTHSGPKIPLVTGRIGVA